jgi:hypothetical protein
MACPICDQKPMNCDCTDEEKRLWRAANEFSDEVDRLRLTDAEREAVRHFAEAIHAFACPYAATLRALLERTKCNTEGE